MIIKGSIFKWINDTPVTLLIGPYTIYVARFSLYTYISVTYTEYRTDSIERHFYYGQWDYNPTGCIGSINLHWLKPGNIESQS